MECGSREGRISARGRFAMILIDEIIKGDCTKPWEITEAVLHRLDNHKLMVYPTETEADPWKEAHPSDW